MESDFDLYLITSLSLSLIFFLSSLSGSRAVPRDMSVLPATITSLVRLVHNTSDQGGAFARNVPVFATAVAFGPVGLAVARVVVQTTTLEAHNTANVVVVVLVLVVVAVVVRGSVHVHGASAMSHVSATSSTVRVSPLVSLSHRDVHVRVAVGSRGHVASHVAHVVHIALEAAWRRAVTELVAAVAGHMSLRRRTNRDRRREDP